MAKKYIAPTYTGKQLRKIREKSGLNQTDFWAAVGFTQSGGSRLEQDNRRPDARTCMLVGHVFDRKPIPVA